MGIHIPTDHVAEVSVTFTDPANLAECESTFYVQDPTDAIFDDVPTFVGFVWAAWVAHVVPVQTQTVISNGVIFEDQRAIPYAGAIFPQTPTPGGLSAGATAMPNSQAFAIKRVTAALGRAGRGRIYMPVWAQNLLSAENAVSTTVANNWVSGLTAFQAALTATALPVTMGIVSKQIGGAPRAAGLFEPILAWAYTDLVPDSQRRRLPGRGR